MGIITNTGAAKAATLTDQISEVLVYMANLQKKYTDETIDAKIEDYVKDLGATKEELKALVEALDGLDFKEDGKIDAGVITAKVANNEAEVKVTKDEIEKVKEVLSKVEKSVESLENNGVDLTPVYNEITSVKNDVANLTTRVETLENTVKTQQTQIEALQLDVAKLKANVNSVF